MSRAVTERNGTQLIAARLDDGLHLGDCFRYAPEVLRCSRLTDRGSVTTPLHRRCTSVKPPLQPRYAAVTSPLHLRCTAALQSSDSKALLKGDKLDKIHRYLEYKKVPPELVGRIIAFYEYQMTSSVSLSQMEEFQARNGA